MEKFYENLRNVALVSNDGNIRGLALRAADIIEGQMKEIAELRKARDNSEDYGTRLARRIYDEEKAAIDMYRDQP